MLTLYCVFGVILPTSGCTLNILHLFNSNRFLHHFPCKYSKDSTLKYHQIKCECIQFLYDPQHTNLIIILNVHLSYLFFYIFWTLTYCFCANCRNYQFSKLFSQNTWLCHAERRIIRRELSNGFRKLDRVSLLWIFGKL